MSIRHQLEHVQLSNVMEVVVAEKLSAHIGAFNMTCTCDRCLSDVLALALNELPAKYIVNDALEPVVRAAHEADQDEATKVLAVLSYATKKVSDAPRCTENTKNG